MYIGRLISIALILFAVMVSSAFARDCENYRSTYEELKNYKALAMGVMPDNRTYCFWIYNAPSTDSAIRDVMNKCGQQATSCELVWSSKNEENQDNINLEARIQAEKGAAEKKAEMERKKFEKQRIDELKNIELKKNFRCKIEGLKGPIETLCDEYLTSKFMSNSLEKFTIEQAIKQNKNLNDLRVAEYENQSAVSRREGALALYPYLKSIPSPAIDCDTTKNQRDKLICQSFELTLLDNTIRSYSSMAKGTENKGDVQKIIDNFEKILKNCNLDVICLKTACKQQVDSLVEFLLAKKITVKRYDQIIAEIEESQALAKAEEEKAKIIAAELEAQRVQALAEQLEKERIRKLEAEKVAAIAAQAEADKLKAQADIERVKSQSEIEKAQLEKAKIDAQRISAEAELVKAEIESQKLALAQAQVDLDRLKAQAEIDHIKAQVEQERAKAEKAKAEAEIAKAEAEKAEKDLQIANSIRNNESKSSETSSNLNSENSNTSAVTSIPSEKDEFYEKAKKSCLSLYKTESNCSEENISMIANFCRRSEAIAKAEGFLTGKLYECVVFGSNVVTSLENSTVQLMSNPTRFFIRTKGVDQNGVCVYGKGETKRNVKINQC